MSIIPPPARQISARKGRVLCSGRTWAELHQYEYLIHAIRHPVPGSVDEVHYVGMAFEKSLFRV